MSITTFEIEEDKLVLHKVNYMVLVPIMSLFFFILYFDLAEDYNEPLKIGGGFVSIILLMTAYIYFLIPLKIELSPSEVNIHFRNRIGATDLSSIRKIEIHQLFPKSASSDLMLAVMSGKSNSFMDVNPTSIKIFAKEHEYRVYFGRMSYETIAPLIERLNSLYDQDCSISKIKVSKGFEIVWHWNH